MRAIRVQVRAGPRIQIGFLTGVVNQLRKGGWFLRQRFLEQADVIQRVQLVGDHATIVVSLVHLQRVDAQRVFGCHVVTHTALGATGEVPRLLALSARGSGIANRKRSIQSLRLIQ